METRTKLGRVSIVPKGEYNATTPYQRLDFVQYEGSGYLVLKDVTGVTPVDGDSYMLAVERGDQGPIGLTGPQGPQGDQGIQGVQGEQGDPGVSISSIERTTGTGAPGTYDTYTITLTDGSTSTFQIYNGANGEGSGDMLAVTYDPQNKAQDIFAYVDEHTPEHIVSSFNGREGVVTPQAGDYTAADVGALPISGGMLTGNLTIKGANNYGTQINLGDGDFVHISESTDDCMEIKAKKVNFVLSDTTSSKLTVNGNPIVGESLANKSVQIAQGKTVTAGYGAEIFNDYRTRTFYDNSADAGNIASGIYSHAEGSCVSALGADSHAEGYATISVGFCSHVEGSKSVACSYNLMAMVVTLNAEEKYVEILPNSSFFNKTRIGDNVILATYEGDNAYEGMNVVSQLDAENNRVYLTKEVLTRYGYPYFLINASRGSSSILYPNHAEGAETLAVNECSHSEGYGTLAVKRCSHAEGTQTKAMGACSHVEGDRTYAFGYSSHVEGMFCAAVECVGHVEGIGCVAALPEYADKITSYVYENSASSYIITETDQLFTKLSINSLVFLTGGATNKALAKVKDIDKVNKKIYLGSLEYDHWGSGMNWSYVVALPFNLSKNSFTATSARASGEQSIALARCANASGLGVIAKAEGQTAIGSWNVESNLNTDKLIIGKGFYYSRANCLRVTNTGVYASGNYNASGADYAEFFEWLDGNTDNADRAGLFVTLEGEKIRLAQPEDDFILGIVSAEPSVCGDVYDDQWKGMYLYDIYGRPLWEDVEVPDETIEEPDPENPGETITRVIVPAHMEHRQKLNPDYDNTQPYVARSERPEWDAVGMLGKLVVRDDGTCEVNGYCRPFTNGIATRSIAATKYRVLSRLDETHIKVLIL